MAQAQQGQSQVQKQGLDIVVHDGGSSTGSKASRERRVHLEVEVMNTPQTRERGLMFRQLLPQNEGMLFEFDTDDVVSMWMKNTYIPLDMIFISKEGTVVSITEHAEPLSEAIIPSKKPVRAVLEVNAGFVRESGIHEGDRLEFPFFRQP